MPPSVLLGIQHINNFELLKETGRRSRVHKICYAKLGFFTITGGQLQVTHILMLWQVSTKAPSVPELQADHQLLHLGGSHLLLTFTALGNGFVLLFSCYEELTALLQELTPFHSHKRTCHPFTAETGEISKTLYFCMELFLDIC